MSSFKRLLIQRYLRGVYEQEGDRLSTRSDSDRTWQNGFNLNKGKVRLGVRQKFFTHRMVRHWDMLLREAVAAPSLEVFKARLDGDLGSLSWWVAALSTAGG